MNWLQPICETVAPPVTNICPWLYNTDLNPDMASSTLPGLSSLRLAELLHWAAYLCVLYLVYKVISLFLRKKKLQRVFSSFPGPKRHWLYGNVHEFKQDGKDLDVVNKYAKQFDYGFPIWLGNFFASLVVYHPNYVKAILSRQDPKDNFAYYFITPWIGKGLLVLSGQKWFQHRKLLTPGFHYDVLKPYVRVTSKSVNVMLDKWEKLAPKKEPVELFHHVSLMTLDTIMKCAFSYESNCQNNSENDYIKAVYELSYLVDHRFRCFPYHNDFIYYLSPHGFRFRRAVKTKHEHTERVIKLRKESLKQETEVEMIKQKRHLDFLDILLCAKDENGQGLSDEDLRAEVDTFMFEGHDTTASGVSWTLYCMAKSERFLEIGPQSSGEYPPVPGVARELKEPIAFFDGRSLPKGTVVLLSMFCMNRSPSMWDNPEDFDPLRFSPENSSKRHSHAYVPFSAGSRNCIGQNFAMNEMKVAIALTLPRFELSLDPDNEPKLIPQLVLRSVNGIHLNLKKIEKAS
ncbi:unnamed protein product [Ranitomeya imitator]|uniref:Cytochrome P450 n=1 Tax=Ranitomeya imitator TaxID=111125 RepID=A0ABN9LY46_9NEOB|nr:unnamed protein product [Ranitomeya imitator]